MDLKRLSEAAEAPLETFIEWLAPDQIDMTGEPESFVLLRQGKRLPVLAFAKDACRFLGVDNRCTVYAARPLSCRTFPIEFDTTAGAPRRLTVLEGASCPGEFDAAADDRSAAQRLEQRQAELERHVSFVSGWNRRQSRRRRLGLRLEADAAFLSQLLSEPDP